MNFFKNLFQKQEEPIKTYSDFWQWFKQNEKEFHKIVSHRGNIEKAFFDKVSPKLTQIREGFYLLTGMFDEETVELVFTADGNIRNFVFIKELVDASPKINGWKFTAFKPSTNVDDFAIEMNDITFSNDKLFFISNVDKTYPDEIDISIIHTDYDEKDSSAITNGIYIFLDNYLGELEFATTIDNVRVIPVANKTDELIPISKLKDFLIWREKEFVEKYEGIRHETENDEYASYEAQLQNNKPLIAIMNSTLMKWEAKPSHPWFLILKFQFDGEDNNGMPNDKDYQIMNKIEDELSLELKDFDGYLNLGRETSDGIREVYFACKEFYKPSKVMSELIQKYSNTLEMEYEIYKDKYWQSLNRFQS